MFAHGAKWIASSQELLAMTGKQLNFTGYISRQTLTASRERCAPKNGRSRLGAVRELQLELADLLGADARRHRHVFQHLDERPRGDDPGRAVRLGRRLHHRI